MKNILLVIKREYLTRIRKKSFILMCVLGPVFFAALFLLPSWLMSIESQEEKKIAVIDSSNVFINKIPETKYLKFDYLTGASLEKLKNNFDEYDYYAVLYITHILHYSPNSIMLYSDKQPNYNVVMHISNAIEKEIERQKLATHDIKNLDQILQSVKTKISIQTVKWTKSGEAKQTNSGLAMAVSYISGFLIYLFIFMFGVQVMRGVEEEKSNRIAEIIISSVKHFELMMGKILGIALVGLTQFLLWIIITVAIVGFAQNTVLQTSFPEPTQAENIFSTSPGGSLLEEDQPIVNQKYTELKNLIQATRSINFGVMIGAFIFFFLAGYMLYASMFAAIGSAIDQQTDTQQFVLPVTIPLIIALFVLLNAFQNPGGPVTFWFSLIPFTSPIVMMARIPYGVPLWEIYLSMGILIITFVGMVWLAGKIFRTGILMYGKKNTLRDMWRWIRYKH